MSPIEQRIALAELCGWHSIKVIIYEGRHTMVWGCLPDYKKTNYPTELVPDYLNDLNAMHDAERHATIRPDFSLSKYYDHLVAAHGTLGAVLATAEQRAKAMLQTLTLYTP